MIQVQFGKANNAPLGSALAIISMFTVGIISIGFVLLSRKIGRIKN
jgi:spermidine/putrescine transport system permease protein